MIHHFNVANYTPPHSMRLKIPTLFLTSCNTFTSRENNIGIGYQSSKITSKKCKRLSILIFCRVDNTYYSIRIHISQCNGCGMAKNFSSDYFLNTSKLYLSGGTVGV